MFKYAIVICVISFCNCAPSQVGNYSQLILILRTPVTAFFAPLPLNTSSEQFLHYMSNNWAIFTDQIWILQGLWAIDSNDQLLTECVNATGEALTYNRDNVDELLRMQLEAIWPLLSVSGEDVDNLWEAEYNKYGSCVTASEKYYFSRAFRAWSMHNINAILQTCEVFPGSKYGLSDIAACLTTRLQKRVYIKCLTAPNNRDQYLFEVQVCLNSAFTSVDCYSSGFHDCAVNKDITYPGNRITEPEL